MTKKVGKYCGKAKKSPPVLGGLTMSKRQIGYGTAAALRGGGARFFSLRSG